MAADEEMKKASKSKRGECCHKFTLHLRKFKMGHTFLICINLHSFASH